MKSYLKKGLLIASLICGIAAYSQAMVPFSSIVGSTQVNAQEFVVKLINNSSHTIECPNHPGQFLSPGQNIELNMDQYQMDMWLNNMDMSGMISDISCPSTTGGAYVVKSQYNWYDPATSMNYMLDVTSDVCMPGKCDASLLYPNKRGYIIVSYMDLPV